VPTVDMLSLRPDMAGSAQTARKEEDVIERAGELRWPIALKDARLEDYDAVYYPGGHGPMEDLAFDADSGKLLVDALASGQAAGRGVPRAGCAAGHPGRGRQVAVRRLSDNRLHQ
jgi:putative intracellular protease/amidase